MSEPSSRAHVLTRRALLRLAACLILLAAAFSCEKPPRKPILPKVPKEAFERRWPGEKVFLIGLGDSITKGFGAPREHSYFEMLVRNAPDDPDEIWGACLSKVWPNLKAINLSESFTTSSQHLDLQVNLMTPFKSDHLGVVVLTTGGNDIIHDYGRQAPREGAMYGASFDQARPWISDFESRLGKILDGVKGRFPGGCHIFLANVYDPTDGVGDIENAGLGLPPWPDGLKILAAVNEAIARQAAARDFVHLVDIRTSFLGHGIHHRDSKNPFYHPDDPSNWYFSNLEDPNVIGHNAVRRLFLIEIAKVFAPPVPPAH